MLLCCRIITHRVRWRTCSWSVPTKFTRALLTATAHVDAASQDSSLMAEDLKELQKAAGDNKAIIGSIATILRPGRAVQASLQDNRWLSDATLMLPRVRAVQEFLVDLLELK